MKLTGDNWRGPVPGESRAGMVRPILGLILHVEQGTEPGTDAWFHRPGAQESAHFGNPKNGFLDQWVDTDDEAWAEAAGNRRYISVEHEGRSGDELTASQIENDAHLLVWLHETEGVPLQLADEPGARGLGWHGMGGQAWGGHLDCPGDPIVAARPAIIARARQLLAPPVPVINQEEPMATATMTPTGKGTWRVHPDGAVFTAGDAEYYGGYPALPPAEREGTRTFLSIERLGPQLADGYVLIADDGSAYRFNAAVWAKLHPAGSA